MFEKRMKKPILAVFVVAVALSAIAVLAYSYGNSPYSSSYYYAKPQMQYSAYGNPFGANYDFYTPYYRPTYYDKPYTYYADPYYRRLQYVNSPVDSSQYRWSAANLKSKPSVPNLEYAYYPGMGAKGDLCGRVRDQTFGCNFGLVCDYTKTNVRGVGACSYQ